MSKAVVVIAVAVVGMIVGMIFIVKDFQKSAMNKKAEEKHITDSLLNAKFEQLQMNDSLFLVEMGSQQSKIENINSKINSIQYKFNKLQSQE